MVARLTLIRLVPILGAVGLAAAPLGPLGSNLVYFDFLDPVNQWILANYLLTGLGAALVFIVIFHVVMQNHSFSPRDIFFLLAGPAIGFLMSVTGATQFEVIQFTFVINMGLGGMKELLKKVTGIDFNGPAPAPVAGTVAMVNTTAVEDTASRDTRPLPPRSRGG